ncbi:MAG: gliding motility-associated C-terminal domain-containing protein [Bacteroidia bacterium]
MREIVVEGVFTLYIPNAFTPNQDGHNDEFFATGYGITAVNMLIFNRWGNKVFETNSLNGKWNGQNLYNGALCAQGVYVYTMKVTDQFGVPHTYQGQVTLIR